MFDQDKNGVIAASELGNVMRTLGLPFSSKELHSMVKNVDIDGQLTLEGSDLCLCTIFVMTRFFSQRFFFV